MVIPGVKLKNFKNLIQGVSKKKVLSWVSSYFSSRGPILLFNMCFGIRILRPFHIATRVIAIQNLNAKNTCADMILEGSSMNMEWSFMEWSSMNVKSSQL